jgi:hypothetical protein
MIWQKSSASCTNKAGLLKWYGEFKRYQLKSECKKEVKMKLDYCEGFEKIMATITLLDL